MASVMGCTRHVLTERCPKRSPRARLRLCGLCCCSVPTGSAGLLAEPQPRRNRWSQPIGGKGIQCPRALGAGVGRSRGGANPSLPLPLPQPGLLLPPPGVCLSLGCGPRGSPVGLRLHRRLGERLLLGRLRVGPQGGAGPGPSVPPPASGKIGAPPRFLGWRRPPSRGPALQADLPVPFVSSP